MFSPSATQFSALKTFISQFLLFYLHSSLLCGKGFVVWVQDAELEVLNGCGGGGGVNEKKMFAFLSPFRSVGAR